MAMEIQEGEVGSVYSSGDMITRVELSSRKGDILRCSVNIEGKDMSSRTATSIPSTAFPSGDDPFLHSEATFTLEGVDSNKIESFYVVKENNNITDLFANNTTRRDIPATKAVVSGSIQILFEDTTHRNRFFNRLPSAFSILYQRGARSFTIALNKLAINSSSRPMDSQTAFIMETLNFTAYVDNPSSENSMKITVVS